MRPCKTTLPGGSVSLAFFMLMRYYTQFRFMDSWKCNRKFMLEMTTFYANSHRTHARSGDFMQVTKKQRWFSLLPFYPLFCSVAGFWFSIWLFYWWSESISSSVYAQFCFCRHCRTLGRGHLCKMAGWEYHFFVRHFHLCWYKSCDPGLSGSGQERTFWLSDRMAIFTEICHFSGSAVFRCNSQLGLESVFSELVQYAQFAGRFHRALCLDAGLVHSLDVAQVYWL